MEDIKILEELINRCKECKFAACEQCSINWTQVQAIEHIIERSKELEQKETIIGKMSKELYHICILPKFYKKRLWKKICVQKKNPKYDCTDKKCTECVLEYFTKK